MEDRKQDIFAWLEDHSGMILDAASLVVCIWGFWQVYETWCCMHVA